MGSNSQARREALALGTQASGFGFGKQEQKQETFEKQASGHWWKLYFFLFSVATTYFAVAFSYHSEGATMDHGARHLVKPDRLSAIDKDAQVQFGDWKFQAVNFLAALDPDFERELLDAEGLQAVPALGMLDDEARKRSTYLFSMLAGWVQGGDLVAMRTQTERNGYESWRRLNAKYAPNLASSHLVLLTEIMSGYGLNTDNSFGTFDTRLAMWKTRKQEYERRSGKLLDLDVSKAILIAYAPASLQSHLTLHADNYATEIALEQAISDFIRNLVNSLALARATPGGAVPMDIGGIADKGKGSKDKKKGKGKGGTHEKGKHTSTGKGKYDKDKGKQKR